jgi:hypothetical protein
MCLERGSTVRVLPYIDWPFASHPSPTYEEPENSRAENGQAMFRHLLCRLSFPFLVSWRLGGKSEVLI